MGLFSSIANVFEASGNKKAAKDAAAWQQAGDQEYIDKISGVQSANDAMFAPYVTSGQNAVTGEDNLVGTNGNDAQASAIAQLQASPLYQSLFRTGQNAVLANGAATGGLRGGNIQSSLANFGQSTLASVIQQQLANLGGLSSQGLNAINTQSTQDNSTANTVGNLLSNRDQVKAGLTSTLHNIDNSTLDSLFNLGGTALGGALGVGGSGGGLSGALSALLGGGSSGASATGGISSILSALGLGGGSSSGGAAASTASNPFTADDLATSLSNLSRTQGGGVSDGLSSVLQGLSF